MSLFLGLDQGTSASKALLMEASGQTVWNAEQAVSTNQPAPGCYEQDPEELLSSLQHLISLACKFAQQEKVKIKAIGLSLQRSGVCAWNKSGQVLHPLITWRDSRTQNRVDQLQDSRSEIQIAAGLPVLPNYSGPKIALLQEQLASDSFVGTLDSFLIYKFSSGQKFQSEAAMSARSLLFDLKQGGWSKKLCRLFSVDSARLAEVRPSLQHYCDIQGLPLLAVLGDAQSALLSALRTERDAVLTLGSIASLAVATGSELLLRPGFSSSILYSSPVHTDYLLEAVSPSCSAVVQTLIDDYKILQNAAELEPLLYSVDRASHSHAVYLPVQGSGSPDWLENLPRVSTQKFSDFTPAEFAAAAPENLAGFILNNLLDFKAQNLISGSSILVTGGLARNAFLLQFIADCSGITLLRADSVQGSARGAALMAQMQSESLSKADLLQLNNKADFKEFRPMASSARDRYHSWRNLQQAVHAGSADRYYSI